MFLLRNHRCHKTTVEVEEMADTNATITAVGEVVTTAVAEVVTTAAVAADTKTTVTTVASTHAIF